MARLMLAIVLQLSAVIQAVSAAVLLITRHGWVALWLLVCSVGAFLAGRALLRTMARARGVARVPVPAMSAVTVSA